MQIVLLIKQLAEGVDFNVTGNETTFLSGTTSGILCLTTQNIIDMVIENSEVYRVSFNSTDEAVEVMDNIIEVTIIDENSGEYILLINLGR